jgi:hypothetical protein
MKTEKEEDDDDERRKIRLAVYFKSQFATHFRVPANLSRRRFRLAYSSHHKRLLMGQLQERRVH